MRLGVPDPVGLRVGVMVFDPVIVVEAVFEGVGEFDPVIVELGVFEGVPDGVPEADRVGL